MTLRNYTWFSLIVFVLAIGLLSQGWNRNPLSPGGGDHHGAGATHSMDGVSPAGHNPAVAGTNQQGENHLQEGNHSRDGEPSPDRSTGQVESHQANDRSGHHGK
ncbi:hypothetical protein GTO89_02200 [Heliobacterium gestii]|uniref:Uncharacterized protein n=1 Tax=Heliomicrobium gestii TaxID=2699 RepID=A0A845LE73_HELGE|nr:hypothetical protein [Heliomicrobium gestii]MBM7865593.1 hypothetical protein [Heliomicrobium gestii]MZP41843.1 hypothetical protein [Heliomicrobium gestii]